MAQSNIFMHDQVTSTSNDSIDLTNIRDITLINLDDTNTIVLAWDTETGTATYKITLQANTDDNDEETYMLKAPSDAKGGTLHYKASAGTPTFRICGVRV